MKFFLGGEVGQKSTGDTPPVQRNFVAGGVPQVVEHLPG
jgi:hypothetical protein